ncbi:hypothetical protein SOVF_068040 [Spinacia oleracea]|uniref:PsbP domain-containing protein 7, chloroplastic n=1 Tax=Spinacia oleracea TaxID=3562 RepID=A0A9R0IDS4_SPIOL|nr:psbP domain-containing protein 7, chloroplastic [Spinacia oleracea]KNA18735.1 hypothetical protein SOVF_068040 [Spinacia oleracea]
MTLQHSYHYLTSSSSSSSNLGRIYLTQSPGDGKGSGNQYGRSPAEQYAPLASTFQRRLLLGIGSASLVAVGANFVGITSFLLGLSPDTGRNLKLDVLYPIRGYSRCIQPNEGFEFIYPATWVADQTLLYRAAERAEQERSLDPLPLDSGKRRKRNVNEPVIAFGPPGSTGELNISVIASSVSPEFRIEAFGGPKEVGEAVIRTITAPTRRPDVKAMLLRSNLRGDLLKNINYYELEFRVESPSFQRHNVTVCCAQNGRLYTLNAQAPESAWQKVKEDFYKIAASFVLTS